jgi:hypothetical protein
VQGSREIIAWARSHPASVGAGAVA